MRRIDAPKRPAFSLLEMMCALAIAMLLLLALYLTLSTQFADQQAGREILAEGEVARSILTRITNDIVNQLGAVDPRGFPNYDASASSSGTGTAMSATPAPVTDTSATVTYNLGVRGDATSLTISGYRVQKPALTTSGAVDATADISSDLRLVSLWLVSDTGLARCEMKQATTQDVDTLPTNLPNQNDFIFAKEVKNILFEYFDGTTWQSEWDGTVAAGEDGTSRTGPPAAIRVTVTLRRYNDPATAALAAQDDGPTYQRIIALPASNWFPPPTTTP